MKYKMQALKCTTEGEKKIAGCYSNETEGANFWLKVLADLQNR